MEYRKQKMTEDTNEMPKLLANWLLTAKTYDTDTDDDSTVASDVECPFDVRVCNKLWISLTLLGCCVVKFQIFLHRNISLQGCLPGNDLFHEFQDFSLLLLLYLSIISSFVLSRIYECSVFRS